MVPKEFGGGLDVEGGGSAEAHPPLRHLLPCESSSSWGGKKHTHCSLNLASPCLGFPICKTNTVGLSGPYVLFSINIVFWPNSLTDDLRLSGRFSLVHNGAGVLEGETSGPLDSEH